MEDNAEELNLIKRLCIVNFIEIQELKKRLGGEQEPGDYQNSVSDHIKALDDKMRNLVKEYPHLFLDEK